MQTRHNFKFKQGNFTLTSFFCTHPHQVAGVHILDVIGTWVEVVIGSLPFYEFSSILKIQSTSRMLCATMEKQKAKSEKKQTPAGSKARVMNWSSSLSKD